MVGAEWQKILILHRPRTLENASPRLKTFQFIQFNKDDKHLMQWLFDYFANFLQTYNSPICQWLDFEWGKAVKVSIEATC